MFRWSAIADKTIFGLTFKMYRDPYASSNLVKSVYKNLELDHYAYKYMESELFAYRILDSNFVSYIEERGDLSRLNSVLIPTDQDLSRTVY